MQSRMGDCFSTVKAFLKEGRKVLFTGCGYQFAGLKRYLNFDDNNLICVDLICHGVDSPKMWHEYIRSLFTHERIKFLNFRDKSVGQNMSSILIKGNTTIFYQCEKVNLYFDNWKFILFLRPSCEVCLNKQDNRDSAITIGDCWGFRHIVPELYDDRGLSSVIVHNEKGRALFSRVSSNLVYKATFLDDVKKYNSDYIRSLPFDHKRRNAFWKEYNKHEKSFNYLLKKYVREPRLSKLICFMKKAVKKCLVILGKLVK